MAKFHWQAALVAGLAMQTALGQARAGAETFEETWTSARRVARVEELTWPWGDACKLEGDLARRACKGIRTARQAALTGKRYQVVVSGAVVAGAFDGKGTLALQARGCVLCKAVVIDGEHWLIGKARVGGEFPLLGAGAPKVADEAAAKEYAEKTVPQLGVEMVFSPTGGKEDAGKDHVILVDVLAWRMVDRCTGEVLASQPESAAAAQPSARAEECGGQLGPRPVAKRPEPGDSLPIQLSRWEVQRTLGGMRAQVQDCYRKYQIPGSASAQIEIQADGSVKSVSLKGDFSGTPTGACLIKAVQKAKFPAFKKGPMRVDYPFILR